MSLRPLPLAVLAALASSACFQNHVAPVRTAELPPPPDPVVRHARKLWIALDPRLGPSQCVTPQGSRPLCFEDVDVALGTALGRALWTSFPGIATLSRGETPDPSDYVLRIELDLGALPPSAGGPGWAAQARGRWRVERDGVPLIEEQVSSVSRADFAYGSALGHGAGEVIDAIAVHIGTVLGALPEPHPPAPRPLPPVTAERAEHATPRVAHAKTSPE